MYISGCSLIKNENVGINYNYGQQSPLNMVETTDYSFVDLGNKESFRVAMLLPLSGKVEAMGNSMKNAAMMAVGDLNNNNLVVQFFDTQSSASGARIAIKNALNSKSDLILGPLLSEEVSAISEEAKDDNIPVISFSTAPDVLQTGIYSLGLLNEEQIDKIIKYAASKNRTRLAIVLPDNKSGINMFKSAINSAQSYGVTLVKAGFYQPDAMEFSKLVADIIGEDRVKISQMKPEDIEKLEEPLEPVELDFDVVLVPESGNRLKSITSMFSYYDVSAPEILFMGTSVWANTNLNKETELYGAVYPVMSLARMARFSQKYNEMFGERPNGLGIFAYDAIALASGLSRKKDSNIYQNITNLDGYYGMSGIFRIFENGKNEHGLDVVRVTSTGQKVVESAPQKFYSLHPEYSKNFSDEEDWKTNMPQIFGKSPEELLNNLKNSQQ